MALRFLSSVGDGLICRLLFTFLGVAVPMVPAQVSAEEAFKEDLSQCALPHGEIVLPDRNTRDGEKGFVLRLSDGSLNRDPWKGAVGAGPKSIVARFEEMRRKSTGDVLYSRLEGGSLVAISGKMQDLGGRYLFECSGQELPGPEAVISKKERSAAGEATPGLIEGVQNGHCYLLETIDGKYAIVRIVLQRPPGVAVVQYVQQPSGNRNFSIPRGKLIPFAEEPVGIEPKGRKSNPVVPIQIREYSKAVESLLDDRRKLVAELMTIAQVPVSNPDQIQSKMVAIEFLDRLRAEEAIPLFLNELEFKSPWNSSEELRVENEFPCVGALMNLGKPASRHAIAAIEDSPTDVVPSDKDDFRIWLLTIVIKHIEGKDVAAFVIQRRLETTTAPQSRARLNVALEKLR